jgi:alpha-L-fucosidase 2
MRPTRRQFLQTSALASLAATQPPSRTAFEIGADEPLDAYQIAGQHLIIQNRPTPSFFEGMLLGNGDIGVCVVVRPDALGLHIGKNDCWDIRVSEEVEEHVLPFPELLKLWQRASEEAQRQGKPEMLFLEQNIDFFRAYGKKVEASYLRSWPRPWPCGTVWLHWDSRWVQPGKHVLDPASGLFTLDLNSTTADGLSQLIQLYCFVDWTTGLISVFSHAPAPILSVSYYPRIDEGVDYSNGSGEPRTKWGKLPHPELRSRITDVFSEFSCFQYFPAIGPTEKMPSPAMSEKDRNFSLCARLTGNWRLEAADSNSTTTAQLSGSRLKSGVTLIGNAQQRVRLDIKVATPRDLYLERLESDAVASGDHNPQILIPQNHAYSKENLDTQTHARKEVGRLSTVGFDQIRKQSEAQWRAHWAHSAVHFKDTQLEKLWYHNQYFLACCLREHKVAPGLFGNWSSSNVGTDWHGDYHMDYNCQQVWWGVFSSNHIAQHLPYIELCQNLVAMSERFAKEKYQMPGAAFPLTAFPVPSQSIAIPAPPWAYQVSMTPWTVQSLWWQYLYTQDVGYLKRVYPMLRAAAQFVAAYVKKGDDGKYHVIPTVSSENWGFTVDFRLNKDGILDLALSQFLLNAVIEAANLLQVDEAERSRWQEIRANLAPYPKRKGPYGEVWLDIADAPAEWVYNVPVPLAPVFPGEQVGIGHGEEYWEIARRSARTTRLEGGNDLVYQPMIRARLGMLDLNWFKEQVAYCVLPNGAANDRVRQIGGRYDDSTDYDYMMRMGFWTENFALPAVLNECMMQSYSGVIRLFPNTQNLGPTRFEKLRAAGAFLMSAAYDGNSTTEVRLFSERGKPARIANPWTSNAVKVIRQRDNQQVAVRCEANILAFDTQAGETYWIGPQ